jgi:diaminobutyrate-2-oxoglutarate transaminase
LQLQTKLDKRSRDILKDNIYNYLKEKESNARNYAETFKMVISSGKNDIIVDSEGKEYIDFLTGAGTLPLGHNDVETNESLIQYIKTSGIQQGLDFSTPTKALFVKTLLDCLPDKMKGNYKVQFCGPTGSDAVDAAIKLFKINTKRSSIISFNGAYHGVGQGPLSLTGDLYARSGVSSLVPNVHFFQFPYFSRFGGDFSEEQYVKFLINQIENTLKDPNSGIEKPATVIIEAIQGEGGCIPAPVYFMKELRRITKELQIPLIIDEVQTGFGRTGKMFAFEHSGIIPDAIVVSKAVGGGLPMACVIFNKKYDIWKKGAHAGSFRGNQLAMVSGIVAMKKIKNVNFLIDINEKSDIIFRRLNKLKEQIPIIKEIRGRGLMVGIELLDSDDVSEKVQFVKESLFEKGIIIESGGRNNSVLRLLPPLTVERKNIFKVLDILEKVLENMCYWE